MICNRCGTQNNDYNQVCIRCGNQLIQNKQIMNNNQSIYNNMNNNLPEKKINNFKKIVFGICIGIILVAFLVNHFTFDSTSSKLDTESKVKKYLNEKYSGKSFTIQNKDVISKNNSSCGSYTEYVWTVVDNSTGSTFEVHSGKVYSGGIRCEQHNTDTYGRY